MENLDRKTSRIDATWENIGGHERLIEPRLLKHSLKELDI
jgi:hypothetical protein